MDNINDIMTLVADAGRDDGYAQFCYATWLYNERKHKGRSAVEVAEDAHKASPRYAPKTVGADGKVTYGGMASASAQSKALKVVDTFTYRQLVKLMDERKIGMSWRAATDLAYEVGKAPKAPKAPKAFDAVKRAKAIGGGLSADERKALAAALLAI